MCHTDGFEIFMVRKRTKKDGRRYIVREREKDMGMIQLNINIHLIPLACSTPKRRRTKTKTRRAQQVEYSIYPCRVKM